MKNHQHWSRHLPEAGSITTYGDEQEYRRIRMASLRRQLNELRREYQREETACEIQALREGWTQWEIDAAKARADQYASVSDYYDAKQREYEQYQ